ncbi:MAG: MFS transporter [Alphaproteobacteria bacterium]|nr:MFS transporter [Alphaproteobacteria bacterium]
MIAAIPTPALNASRPPGPWTFAGIYTLESAVRALTATMIPLQAYLLLGEPRLVSLIYLAISCASLVGGFVIPIAISRIGRGRVYGLGASLLVVFPLLLATGTLEGQIAGMAGRALASVCTVITFQLYVMDYIAKRDLVRSEPLRFQMGSLIWAFGPTLGVFLYERFGALEAMALPSFFGAMVLLNFLRLGLKERTKAKPPGNPLANIRRFAEQPRLTLAWTIALARAIWWGMCMVYLPLYLVRAGEPPIAGAIASSLAVGLLFFTPVWGRIAVRFGIRRSVIACFVLLGLSTLAAAAVENPYLAAALIVLGGLPAGGLDGVGGIPFLRAVHSYERPQMAGIYRTYVEVGDLLSSAVYAVLLSFFDIPAVFVAAALGCFGAAVLSRYLPRTM